MVKLGKWEWGWDKKLLSGHSNMHSEKSSLVLIVSQASLDVFFCISKLLDLRAGGEGSH